MSGAVAATEPMWMLRPSGRRSRWRLVAKRRAGEACVGAKYRWDFVVALLLDEARGCGFLFQMFNAWDISPEADMALPGTRRLFSRAQVAGVEVFYITGRPEDQTAATAKSLEAAGYRWWKGLSLREGPQKNMATVEFKSEQRKKIVDAAHRIVMSVGTSGAI